MLPFKIFSFEILLLLAALALMVYIQKQQVSKIYSYLSSAIFILVLALIGSTLVVSMCHHQHELKGMHPMHGAPHLKKEIIIKDGAELEEEFEMNEGEMPCDKPCCAANKEGEPQIIRKEIIIKNGDSLPQKRIIIQKK